MGRGRREVTSPQVYSPDRPEPSDFLAPPDPSVTQNPNVEWIYGKMTWIMYVLLVFVPRWILAQIISLPLSWVLVHLAHNCVCFERSNFFCPRLFFSFSFLFLFRSPLSSCIGPRGTPS